MPETADASSQNCTLFRLTARRVKAAQLVAEDSLSDERIAAAVGISRRGLAKWKQQPAFIELVNEIAEKLAAEIRGKGLVELSAGRSGSLSPVVETPCLFSVASLLK
jgi:hypothetical protein